MSTARVAASKAVVSQDVRPRTRPRRGEQRGQSAAKGHGWRLRAAVGGEER